MKKIFLTVLIFLVTTGNVFAKSIAPINLERKYSTVLETFFQNIQERKYEEAYAMTSKDFHSETNFETFRKIITATEIASFTEKKWTDIKRETLGLFPLISGEFITPRETHQLEFRLIQEGEGLKIRNITESITLNQLKSRFPSRKDQISTAQKDLTAILNFIQQNNPKGLQDYLSDEGKKQTKLLTIKNLFRKIHTKKIAINLPEDTKSGKGTKLKIFRPSLAADASMQIKGEYKNSTSLVKFTLIYNYQWEWLFKGFSISITPGNS